MVTKIKWKLDTTKLILIYQGRAFFGVDSNFKYDVIDGEISTSYLLWLICHKFFLTQKSYLEKVLEAFCNGLC